MRTRSRADVASVTTEAVPASSVRSAGPEERSGEFRIADLRRPSPPVPSLPSLVPSAPAAGPKRYGSVRMEAVRPAPSDRTVTFDEPLSSPAAPPSAERASANGRTLDELDFLGGGQNVVLELDGQPASRRGLIDPGKTGLGSDNVLGSEPRRLSSTSMSAVRAPGPQRTASGSFKAADARPGVFAFAGFGLPPESLFATTTYALRAFGRQRVLREGLRAAKARGSTDAELYEAALATVDARALATGTTLLVLLALSIIGAMVGAALAF